MYELTGYDVDLSINLDNGIYVFYGESATGKTRLAKLLRAYGNAGEPVNSYTYADKQTGLPISTVLIPGKYRVIMIDRYDMYRGDGIDLMHECAKDTIILVDCKKDSLFTSITDWCSINMAERRIEVAT